MWQLGQTFLQKYQFTFDEDRKIFGFYKNIIKNSDTFILYNNKLFKYRKIRVNELEDNFEYIIQS